MKPPVIAAIVATLTTVSTLSMGWPSQAKPTQYFCSVRNGVPTTLARTPQGTVEVISWRSKAFNSSGFSPQQRCQAVSQRFQKQANQGNLRYIAAGVINKQRVICVAQSRGGSCRPGGLLFTLEEQDNPQSVLKDLFNVASRVVKRPTGRGVAATQVEYIDMDDVLSQKESGTTPDSTGLVPVDAAASQTTPVIAQPQQSPSSPTPIW